MGAALAMPPSQYDNLMRRLEELSKQIQDIRVDLRNQAVSESDAREVIDKRINHALYGGNGDGPGIYERLRQLFGWRDDHLTTHESIGTERRSSVEDWRRFWIGVADRTFTVMFAVAGILIVFALTGKVVTF